MCQGYVWLLFADLAKIEIDRQR